MLDNIWTRISPDTDTFPAVNLPNIHYAKMFQVYSFSLSYFLMFGLNKRLKGKSSFTVLPKATVFYSETKCKNDMKTPICKFFENNSFTEHLRTTTCDTSHYIQTLRYVKQETFVFKVVLRIDLQKNNFS